MAKTKKIEPRLSVIDFYRFRGDEFLQAIFEAIERALGEGSQRLARWAKLNRYQQGIYGWWHLYREVENGGLAQFFYNRTDAFLPAIMDLLKATGNTRLVPPLKRATAIYHKRRKEFETDQPFGEDGLFARMTDLAKLDKVVGRQVASVSKALEKWVRANLSKVVAIDGGKSPDPRFSGELETYHPDGKIFEQATVQNGLLAGPYKRYLPDGKLDYSCFYERGQVSTDYWPTGQPKHKTLKRGKLKIYEWYYPSGKIQKRFVADKLGYAVEPVRLWHENGQLAEEVNSRRGNKLGPWLKFFADGSPRLQAEHRKGESLVVKNAWDESGRQTVKNGRGTFFNDGKSIDVNYELFFTSGWTESEQLRGGVPHGLSTTWNHGVLWSKAHFRQGKLHGTSTSFYDNGRVQERSEFRNGKKLKTQEFPKFDSPQPAVLLKVEADDELYAAWGHRLLDRYPTPRNLKQVQAALAIPQFLQEVFERNKSGELADDYEDMNDFDDNIAYMVMVNERGTVDSADFSGSSVYSAAVADVYPPSIRKLTFRPGRLRGQNVRCQVVVWVHHTFVDGDRRRLKRLLLTLNAIEAATGRGRGIDVFGF